MRKLLNVLLLVTILTLTSGNVLYAVEENKNYAIQDELDYSIILFSEQDENGGLKVVKDTSIVTPNSEKDETGGMK